MELQRIYLDNAATTPVDQRVLENMLPYFSEHFGNPASIHTFCQEAESAMEYARETVAQILICQPKEIIFTSCSALNVIIHLARLVDGSRRIISFQEIVGMEGDTIHIHELFSFEQTGIDEEGKVRGRSRARGIRPRFMERFAALNIPIPSELFDAEKVYEI